MTDGSRVGGHVSLGSKPAATIRSMREMGFSCLQIHASSPRTWRIPARTPESFPAVKQMCLESGLDLYLHAIYLINLASDDGVIYDASIKMLTWNVGAAHALGAKAVTFHVGSHRGRGFAESRSRIVKAIETILAQTPPTVSILLENSAGAGGCIGGSWHELGSLIQDLGAPANVGLCLDTAHAFAAGCELSRAGALDHMFDEIDASAGLESLALLHLNDSKAELGSCRDRHENIGAGYIGEAGFQSLLSRSEIARLPMILETPNLERRPLELAMLRRLACMEKAAA